MQVFVNSPRHSCLLRTLSPHRGGLSNTHWLHRFVASPPPPSSLASSLLASPDIIGFVFTYITVVWRGTSPSTPSSLPISLLLRTLRQQHWSLLLRLLLIALCSCSLLLQLIAYAGNIPHWHPRFQLALHYSNCYFSCASAVTPQLIALISLVASCFCPVYVRVCAMCASIDSCMLRCACMACTLPRRVYYTHWI